MIWVDTTKRLSWCVFLSCSVSGSLVRRSKGQSQHMFPAFRHMSPALPELTVLFFFPAFLKLIAPSPLSPNAHSHYIWSYLARKPCRVDRTDEVSWTLSMLRGTREVLTGRGQRWRSTHHWLRASCHEWTDRRITWNLNWFFFFFFWVRETEISAICWPPLMECVTGGPKTEQEKECRQTANVISGKDKRCLLKSATGQLPLRTLLSHPAECKLLNCIALVTLMSRKLHFYPNNSTKCKNT